MKQCILAVAAVLLAASCSAPARTASTSPAVEPSHLTVLAAASLTDVLPQIADDFADEHPGVTVTFSFGSSATLAQQVVAGAPADALITASSTAITPVVEAGIASAEPVTIAHNRLEIVVPADNPGHVSSLRDLARPDLVVVLCAESVPCGSAAEEAFAKARMTPAVDSREQDVRAVLTKVQLGEADAGVVYRSDVQGADSSVVGVAIADEMNVIVQTQAVAVASSDDLAQATEFVGFLRGAAARQRLSAAGFDTP